VAGMAANESTRERIEKMSIILDHVNYVYGADTPLAVHALNDVCLKIPDGQFIGIIGHTGSGKSTLMQHMNGLIRATDGHIYFNGEDIYDKDYDMKKLRSKVGLVFQYPAHQLFEIDVFSDVCFGPKNLGLDKKEVELRAYDALKKVGLPDELFYQSPFELSGGQKRRVAIAGVLAMKPEVLILDEQILEEGSREALIGYLKQEEHIGEDVYVFRTDMLGDVFHWKGARESSIGEYLQGIQENRTSGQQKKGVTLREVYHQFCQDGTLPWLPEIWVEGELLEVDYGSNE